jgi:hypothetical protein
MAISKEDARELARIFREISVKTGDFRFRNWDKLSPEERRTLEDVEWTLLNNSSDLITTAAGIVLADMEKDLKAITDAVAEAKTVVDTIKSVQDILKVTAAMIALGGAIAFGKPDAILSAAGELSSTVKCIHK